MEKNYKRYFELKDFKRRFWLKVFIVLTDISAVLYFYWFIQHAIWTYYTALYLTAELLIFLLFNLLSFNLGNLRFHKRHPKRFDFTPSVDVFITTCEEPIEVIYKTIEASAKIDYSNKTIYVLDDGASSEVQRIAEEFGCKYITRPIRRHAKAGNYNNGLKYAVGEFILTLDADQIPRPYMIAKLIGYFVRDDIGFVQSAQDFSVPLGDPYISRDKLFYGAVQLGKDAANSVISCGSGIIYRRKALDNIGGFSEWNVVEDLHTSYLLQQNGWKGIYFNYRLSKGIAPFDYPSVALQRHKWAVDTLRLFLWDNPLFKKGLSIRQKLNFFSLGILYINTAVAMPIFFLLPVWSLLTDSFIIRNNAMIYLAWRIPYLLLMVFTDMLLYRNKYVLKTYQTWNSFFPVFFHALVVALFSRRRRSNGEVTAKQPIKHNGKTILWRTCWIQIFIVLLYGVSFVYGVLNYWDNKHIILVNGLVIIWGCYILVPNIYEFLLSRFFNSEKKDRAYIYFIRNRIMAKTFTVSVLVLCGYFFFNENIIFAIRNISPKYEQSIITSHPKHVHTKHVKLHRDISLSKQDQKPLESIIIDEQIDSGRIQQVSVFKHLKAEEQTTEEILIAEAESEKNPFDMSPQEEELLKSAQALSWSGKQLKAIPYYKKIFKINPKNIKAHRGLGDAYYWMDYYPGAEKHYSRALSLGDVSVKEYANYKNIVKFFKKKSFLKTMVSYYDNNTGFIRKNVGLNYGYLLANYKKITFSWYGSELKEENIGKVFRNSFNARFDDVIHPQLSYYLQAGINKYSSIGDNGTFSVGVEYKYTDASKLNINYYRNDIIDTTNIFEVRYYNLVNHVIPAKKRIYSNMLELEVYHKLTDKIALYSNVNTSNYSDNNKRDSLYISPMYKINKYLIIKYGFYYLAFDKATADYYSPFDLYGHSLILDFTYQISKKINFRIEETVGFNVKADKFENASLASFDYQIKDLLAISLSSLFTNNRDTNTSSVYKAFNTGLSLTCRF